MPKNAKADQPAKTYCTWCKGEVSHYRFRANTHTADGQVCAGSGLVVATR